MASLMVNPGDVFGTDFEIRSSLGSGGFATVYQAVQRSTGRDVALKLLDLQDDLAKKRFFLEAKSLEKLSHPHIVELIDHGVLGGQHFLVLEFVAGQTLRDIVERQGALGPRRAVAIIRQIAEAVGAAHEVGVLHRDLKPDNVMIQNDDAVKLLDFGIAKVLGPAAPDAPRTAFGKVVGTPRYMSPEALCGKTPSPASDVFSLGVLLYEMLVGDRLFSFLSGNPLVARMVDHDPIEVPEDADVPNELRALLWLALQKEAANRIESVPELIARLDRLPDFPAKTRVMLPHEFADMHRGEHTTTPAVTTEQTTNWERQEPAAAEATETDVRAAAARIKEEAEARLRPGRLVTPPPEFADEPEQHAQPRRTHAMLDEDSGPPPELDRPPARRRWVLPDWRQVVGFGVLGIALILAAGYFAGVVGIKVSIVSGHPLECGFGNSSLHIERHLVLFGAEVVRVEREIRCVDGAVAAPSGTR